MAPPTAASDERGVCRTSQYGLDAGTHDGDHRARTEGVRVARGTAAARRAWLFGLELGWYLIVAALIVVGDIARPSPPGTGRGVWTVMLLLGLCAAVAAMTRWWRPTWLPVTALVVIAAGVLIDATLPLGSLGPLRLLLSGAVTPVVLGAAVRCARPATAALAVVLAVVSAGVDVVRRGNTLTTDVARGLHGATPSPPFVVTTAALLVLAPVVVGVILRSTDAARRAEVLARVRTEERLQVARELHDLVANHVTGMIVVAQAAGLDASTPPPTARALQAIEDAGNDALAAMHRMVGALRALPPTEAPDEVVPERDTDEVPGAPTSPAAAIRAAIGDDDRVDLQVGEGLDDPGSTAEVAADVVTTVHRIVTEALTNARRHSPDGSRIDVEVNAAHPSLLVLEIANDRGAATRVRSGGFGLVGLTERAAAVGGHLAAGPDGEHRWRVRAEIPY